MKSGLAIVQEATKCGIALRLARSGRGAPTQLPMREVILLAMANKRICATRLLVGIFAALAERSLPPCH